MTIYVLVLTLALIYAAGVNIIEVESSFAHSGKTNEDTITEKLLTERLVRKLQLRDARSMAILKDNLFPFHHMEEAAPLIAPTSRNEKRVSPRRPLEDLPFAYHLGLSMERFLSEIIIISSGVWDNGELTVNASFPTPSDFTWVLAEKSSPNAEYTKGLFNVVSSRLTSILTLTFDELYFYDLHLQVTTPRGSVYFVFDEESLHAKGEMGLAPEGPIIDCPDEVRVEDDGSASFELSSAVQRDTTGLGLDVFYSFLNTSSSSPKLGGDILYSSFDDLGPFNNITVDVGENAQLYGGSITVAARPAASGLLTGNAYAKYVTVDKTLPVIPNENVTTSPDGVAFLPYTKVAETKYVDRCDRHASIYCSAIGSERPEIRILKNGIPLPTYDFGRPGVFRQVFHPLYGTPPFDLPGEYTCEASCGNMTITRRIVVPIPPLP